MKYDVCYGGRDRKEVVSTSEAVTHGSLGSHWIGVEVLL